MYFKLMKGDLLQTIIGFMGYFFERRRYLKMINNRADELVRIASCIARLP